jgi:hypothetical protein
MAEILVSVFAQHPLRGPGKLGRRGFVDAIAAGLFLLQHTFSESARGLEKRAAVQLGAPQHLL